MEAGAVVASRWEGAPVEHWRRLWGVPALYVFRRVGSTSDVARRLAEDGAPGGTVVVAEEQTAGRGRGGRRWHAPPGSALLLSLLVRPRRLSREDAYSGGIPLRVGLAVARTVEETTGLRPGIKWPNDVILEGEGKLAGILCEGVLAGPDGGFVVVGIGVNVGQVAADFPPEVRALATSLRLASGREVSRSLVAGVLIREVLAGLDLGGGPLGGGVLEEIARRDSLLGRRVAVDGEPRGVAWGIAPDGALLVRDATGRVAPIYNGTVRVVDARTAASRKDDS